MHHWSSSSCTSSSYVAFLSISQYHVYQAKTWYTKMKKLLKENKNKHNIGRNTCLYFSSNKSHFTWFTFDSPTQDPWSSRTSAESNKSCFALQCDTITGNQIVFDVYCVDLNIEWQCRISWTRKCFWWRPNLTFTWEKMINLFRTHCYLWRHIVHVKLNLSLTFRKEQTVGNKNQKTE